MDKKNLFFKLFSLLLLGCGTFVWNWNLMLYEEQLLVLPEEEHFSANTFRITKVFWLDLRNNRTFQLSEDENTTMRTFLEAYELKGERIPAAVAPHDFLSAPDFQSLFSNAPNISISMTAVPPSWIAQFAYRRAFARVASELRNHDLFLVMDTSALTFEFNWTESISACLAKASGDWRMIRLEIAEHRDEENVHRVILLTPAKARKLLAFSRDYNLSAADQWIEDLNKAKGGLDICRQT